jgi:hypothetical protein
MDERIAWEVIVSFASAGHPSLSHVGTGQDRADRHPGVRFLAGSRSTEDSMEHANHRRLLIVANRTTSTPQLLDEIERRGAERSTTFALLVPEVSSRRRSDWSLERAGALLDRAAGSPVERLRGEGGAFEAIRAALDTGEFDEVLISTLPRRTSEWLRRDLPRRVERLGVPVTVIGRHGVEPGACVEVSSRLP